MRINALWPDEDVELIDSFARCAKLLRRSADLARAQGDLARHAAWGEESRMVRDRIARNADDLAMEFAERADVLFQGSVH